MADTQRTISHAAEIRALEERVKNLEGVLIENRKSNHEMKNGQQTIIDLIHTKFNSVKDEIAKKVDDLRDDLEAKDEKWTEKFHKVDMKLARIAIVVAVLVELANKFLKI